MIKTNTISKLVMAVILLSGGLFTSTAMAQASVNNALYDARLLNHYSEEELSLMKTETPDKYTAVVYYYTQSYTIESLECFDCAPLDKSTFDISKYENLRKINEIAVFKNFKQGFTLYLTPINQLEYKLPIHLARLEYNH